MRLNCQRVVEIVGLFVFTFMLLLPALVSAEVDITDKVDIIKGRMITDRRTGDALIDVSIRNVSDEVLLAPIRVVVTSVSSTAVTVADIDGITADGFPYYEYTLLTGQILPGETVSAKKWKFENPTRERFVYTIKVMSPLPDVAAVIGSMGGHVQTETGIEIEIPSGSIITPKVITLKSFSSEQVDTLESVDNSRLLGAANFGPDGLVFDWPVTITIPLDIKAEPGTTLPLYVLGNDSGFFVSSGFTCTVDDIGGKCIGDVTHFSTYAPGIPSRAFYLWPFGDHDCPFTSSGYVGSCANFVPSFSDTLGPRVPYDKPYSKYTIWSKNNIFDIKAYPVWDVATRLFSSKLYNNPSTLTAEPVLFIHGYQPKNNFGGGEKYWGDFINLIDDLKIDNREFTVFDFQWRTNARFVDVAEDLYSAIKQISAKTGDQKVHIIAHSFGGVVVRTMLQLIAPKNGDPDVASMVASLTTIGTPHSGIADTAKFVHEVSLPKGQDSWALEAAGQISVHQMGEPIPLSLSSEMCSDLDMNCIPGEIPAKLSLFDVYPLPSYLPMQIAIGMTARTECMDSDCLFSVDKLNTGDNLISYEGQRFSPELTINGQLPLLSGQTAFNSQAGIVETGAYVVETLLGLNGKDFIPNTPNAEIDLSKYPNFGSRGYKHSPLTLGLSSYVENYIDCGDIETCDNASFIAVKDWLEKYSSISSNNPYFKLSFALTDDSTIPSTSLFAGAGNIQVLQNGVVLEGTSYDGKYLYIPFYPSSNYEINISIDGYQPKQISHVTTSLIDQPFYDKGQIYLTLADPDSDGDGIPDSLDNCISIQNSDQADLDGDRIGDVCDSDADADGFIATFPTSDLYDCNDLDSTIFLGAPEICGDNIDQDCDGKDLVCIMDMDQDGIPDTTDNCPSIANTDQYDADNDGVGDVCDTSQETDLTTGLVAYYPFDGNANDESGNANDGVVNGATLTMDRFGNVDSAYSFDGVDDNINLGNSPDFDFTTECTFSVWIRSASENGGRILNKWVSGTEDKAVFLNPDGNILFYLFGSSTEVQNSNSLISSQEWVHIVAVYDGSEQKIYIDGELTGSFLRSGLIRNSYGNLYVGENIDRLSEGSWAFGGDIDDIKIYNRALSSSEVSVLYGGSIGTATSLTGRVWMDKNLGASQVATAYNDSAAYGDLYQWGRGTDGHEKRTSPITTTLSSSDTPGHGSFILAPSSPYDWRNPQNDNLWQGVSGVNNPCPSGFRLPTITEWEAERATWSTNDQAGAFASPLKLGSAGFRNLYDGSINNAGSSGYYWSSSVTGGYARDLNFNSGYAYTFKDTYPRANGFSVRCLAD